MSSHLFSLQGRALKLDTLESIEPYLEELHEVVELEEVRLDGNTLGVEACAGLASALSTKSTLRVRSLLFTLNETDAGREQVVNLSDIFTGRLITEIPPSLVSLCSSLLRVSSLTSLDLSDNAFGGRSVEPMYVYFSP